MRKKGPITVPAFDPNDVVEAPTSAPPEQVMLPARPVIDAGVAKFLELAALHWPSPGGGFKLTSFDIHNSRQLRMTLGLVYMAMLDAEDTP